MALKTLKTYVDRKNEKYYVTGTCRGFKVAMDEPKEVGGTNQAMSPMEMVLCGLGGCQIMYFTTFAKEYGIDVNQMWIELEGDYDDEGFKGTKDIRAGFIEIRCIIHVRTEASEDKVRELVQVMEKMCPVHDTLSNLVHVQIKGVVIEQ